MPGHAWAEMNIDDGSNQYGIVKENGVVSEIVDCVSDPEARKKMLKTQQSHIVFWLAVILGSFGLFYFISNEGFSFAITVATLINMGSFCVLAMAVHARRTCNGLSVKMLECYCILLVARLMAILPIEDYLPQCRSGDFFYRFFEMGTLVACAYLVYVCKVQYKETYDTTVDNFNIAFILAPSLLLSLFANPHFSGHLFIDIAWAFSMGVETLAAMPQLYMFVKESRVEPYISHFLAGQVISKALAFVYWVPTCYDLAVASEQHATWWILILFFAQFAIMADFSWKYIKCFRKGIPMTRLVTEDV